MIVGFNFKAKQKKIIQGKHQRSPVSNSRHNSKLISKTREPFLPQICGKDSEPSTHAYPFRKVPKAAKKVKFTSSRQATMLWRQKQESWNIGDTNQLWGMFLETVYWIYSVHNEISFWAEDNLPGAGWPFTIIWTLCATSDIIHSSAWK